MAQYSTDDAQDWLANQVSTDSYFMQAMQDAIIRKSAEWLADLIYDYLKKNWPAMRDASKQALKELRQIADDLASQLIEAYKKVENTVKKAANAVKQAIQYVFS